MQLARGFECVTSPHHWNGGPDSPNSWMDRGCTSRGAPLECVSLHMRYMKRGCKVDEYKVSGRDGACPLSSRMAGRRRMDCET